MLRAYSTVPAIGTETAYNPVASNLQVHRRLTSNFSWGDYELLHSTWYLQFRVPFRPSAATKSYRFRRLCPTSNRLDQSPRSRPARYKFRTYPSAKGIWLGPCLEAKASKMSEAAESKARRPLTRGSVRTGATPTWVQGFIWKQPY